MDLPETTKDITAGWLDEVLHDNGYLKVESIVSIKHEAVGTGEGFLSDMARLTLEYSRESPDLPETMLAKLPTSHESSRTIAMALRLYEREIKFYLEVAPISPVRTPGLIYADIDSENKRYVLLMEDCSGYTPADPGLKGLDYEQTKTVVLKIADFHIRWWDNEGLQSFPWLPKPQSKGRFATIDFFRKGWDTCAESEDFKRILPEGGWEAGLKIYEHFPWLVEIASENNLTIRHTDLRPDNMFFDWNTPENPLILFDWSLASVGRGADDIAFLLGFSLATDFRRQVEKEMLQLYYQRLLDNGISNYSSEEYQEDYLKALLHFTANPLVAYASLDTSNPRKAELSALVLNRWFSATVDNDATSILP